MHVPDAAEKNIENISEKLRFVDFFSQTKLFLRFLRRSREGYDADQTQYFTHPKQFFVIFDKDYFQSALTFLIFGVE